MSPGASVIGAPEIVRAARTLSMEEGFSNVPFRSVERLLVMVCMRGNGLVSDSPRWNSGSGFHRPKHALKTSFIGSAA